ncbi:AAA-like domain-containing protein [Prochlorothrix hollandica]|nr:AAA-like domain-containing protein [Prochlorothrix hollandica]
MVNVPESSPAITYTVGGTVQAGSGYYVTRAADGELLELCLAGEFAYVLTSRQMGKSSLMVRTADRLRDKANGETVTPVIVDLQEIGTPSQEEWYFGFLAAVVDQFEVALATDLYDWWDEQRGLGITQRLTRFFDQVLLPQVAGRIVIFVDEIDTTLSLDYTDDFFIAIRYFYTVRAENPAFQRLSFVLLGVATPGELIKDGKRTPFNIGRRVELMDFSETEAAPLAAGLGLPESQGAAVFGEILGWTGGHPYLTQRLCGAVRTHPPAPSRKGEKEDLVPSLVDGLVEALFLGEGSEQDNNLQFVRDMLTGRAPGGEVLGLLQIYREIWREKVVLDEEQSILKNHLKLAGIVGREGSRLVVRNRIYERVFDRGWLRRHWPLNWVGQLRLAWKVVAVSAAVTLGVGWLGLVAYNQSRQLQGALTEVEAANKMALANEGRANQNAREAEIQAGRAEEQRQVAEGRAAELTVQTQNLQQQRALAQENAARAEESAREAAAQTTLAEARQQVAEEAQRDAVAARLVAEVQRRRAETATVAAEESAREAEEQRQVAERQAAEAKLREQAAVVLTWMPTRQAPKGMALALQTYASADNQKTSTSVLKFSESSLLSAVQQLKESQRLEGHEQEVYGVAISPDGERIVSGSDDGTLRLWDLQGQQIGEPFQGHTNWVLSVAFSPDGERIVSGSSDGTLRLWHASPTAWFRIGCNRLRYHPLFRDPATEIPNDPELLESVVQARQACQTRVWDP